MAQAVFHGSATSQFRVRMEKFMHSHGPSCLEGPISRAHSWWKRWSSGKKAVLVNSADSSQRKPASGKRPRGDSPIRKELVERIRREIAAGTYETPEKWEKALDRLFEKMEEDE